MKPVVALVSLPGWGPAASVGNGEKRGPAKRSVEMWRGDSRSGLSVAAPFVWRCPSNLAVAPFPHPPHQTGRADFPHPAFGQDFTPSPTPAHAPLRSNVRARSTRTGARVDSSCPLSVWRYIGGVTTDATAVRCNSREPCTHHCPSLH